MMQVTDRADTPPATGGIRYRQLGYVAIDVTDVERSRAFYRDIMGLQVTQVGADGTTFLRCSDDHHDIILYPAAAPGLHRVGWQVEDEAQLDGVAAVAARAGIAVTEVPLKEAEQLHQGRSLRFTEPLTGAPLEFFTHMASGYGFEPTQADIQRLGHVVLATPDYLKAVDFFLNELNFRASDQIGERITFMRCFPNPFHHSVGMAAWQSAGLHHINFMVTSIDDVGRALYRFRNNDVPIVYGPGRHPPSDSVFIYASDPDGITVEYSYGMEEFPELDPRPPRMLPMRQDSSDTWGGPPPRIVPVPMQPKSR